MERTLITYKPAVSKKLLLLISGVVWLFAAFFLVRRGTFYMFDYSHHILYNVGLGFMTGILFFAFIFFRIVKKHVTRILKLNSEKPCMFAFTGISGYIAIGLMVSAGIFLRKFHLIDYLTLNVFYICMGTALFISSIKFFISVLFFRKISDSANAPLQ